MTFQALLILLFVIIHDCQGQVGRALSVHTLDSTTGGGAPNITVNAYLQDSNTEFSFVATNVTNADGRISALIPEDQFSPGTYRLNLLNIQEYFNRKNMSTFWPQIQITFIVRNTRLDHHIPITLSPFGFQTYRGI